MSGPVSYGFARPGRMRVGAGPWSVTMAGGDGPVEDPDLLPNWDHSTDLEVRRRIDVDLAGALADCGLGPATKLSAAIHWHSTWTGLRGVGPAVIICAGTNDLALRLAGVDVGGALNLEVRVVLACAEGIGPISPHRPGSTLWADRRQVALEGSGMRFPVFAVDFFEAGIAAGTPGAWALRIDNDDPGASGTGSIRLYLNTAKPAVEEMLNRPESARAAALFEFLRLDVTRQLVTLALGNDELTGSSDDYDEDSLGALLLSIVERNLGGPLDELRARYRSDPGEVEAEIQARSGFLAS